MINVRVEARIESDIKTIERMLSISICTASQSPRAPLISNKRPKLVR